MTAPKTTTRAAKTKDEPEQQPCERCWPDGWPTEDTPSANCVHGSWTRDLS